MQDPMVLAIREELDLVKEEQKRQAIRSEVLEDGLTSLTRELAEFREEFNAFESATNEHFAQLHKLITDGHATIISAVMTLAKK